MKEYPWTIERLKAVIQDERVFYYIDHFMVNKYINKKISFQSVYEYICSGCNRQVKYLLRGHCWQCLKTKPYCDLCMVRPSLCHFHLGTCRDYQWGFNHCFADHCVYLSYTSDLKVGITRFTNIANRAINQGAIRFMPIIRTKNRKIAGIIENRIGKIVKTSTYWHKMLNTNQCTINIEQKKYDLFSKHELLEGLDDFFTTIEKPKVQKLIYPIYEIPKNKNTLDIEENPSGKLLGIKGQYIIMSTGFLNINKFIGHKVKISIK